MANTFSTAESQASYGIGLQMGEQLRANPFEGLDIEAVQAGLADAFNRLAAQVDNETLGKAFNEIHQKMQAAKSEKFKDAIAQGEAYLADNAKREDITVTASGLQYEILEVGDGELPNATSTVRTHYHGTLIDGTAVIRTVKHCAINERTMLPQLCVLTTMVRSLMAQCLTVLITAVSPLNSRLMALSKAGQRHYS